MRRTWGKKSIRILAGEWNEREKKGWAVLLRAGQVRTGWEKKGIERYITVITGHGHSSAPEPGPPTQMGPQVQKGPWGDGFPRFLLLYFFFFYLLLLHSTSTALWIGGQTVRRLGWLGYHCSTAPLLERLSRR